MPSMWSQFNQEETFGKNRVQYHREFQYWWQYETEHFITYWYGGNRTMAEVAVFLAEKNYGDIQRLLEHSTNEKIELIIFRDLTDLKQSNLGTEEVFQLTRGSTKVIRNKVFVYFDGDQNHLERQIRNGISRVLAQFMLQGSAVQEFVRSTFFNSLPAWFIPGLVTYLSDPADPTMTQRREAWYRQLASKKHSGKNATFDDLAHQDPTLAGYMMWDFIYQQHGPLRLSNLLYISRINKDMNNAFLYALEKPVDEVKRACMSYYDKQRARLGQVPEQEASAEIPIKRVKRSKRAGVGYEMTVTDMAISPSGHQVTYVTNEIGRYKIWLTHGDEKRHDKLIQGGFRNPFQTADHNYPQVSFLSEHQLAVLEERRDVLYLQLHDLETGALEEQKVAPGLDRVYSMDILSADTLVLSAIEDEYVDLYLYMPRTRQYTKLTDDYYDDQDAHVVWLGARPYVAFSSNRPTAQSRQEAFDTITVSDTRDIYLMSLTTGVLQQLTNTPNVDEWAVTSVGDSLYYLSDANGSAMRYVLPLRAEVLEPRLYSYCKQPIEVHALSEEWILDFAHDEVGVPQIRRYERVRSVPVMVPSAGLPTDMPVGDVKVTSPMKPAEVVPWIYFQTEFDEAIPIDQVSDTQSGDTSVVFNPLAILPISERISGEKSTPAPFNSSRTLAYRLRFGVNDFDFNINNDLLFTGLNSFAGFQEGFEYPDPGLLMRAELRDLFENYVVSGGARLPLTFDGTEFFLSVSDRRRRLDKTLSFYRRSQREREDIRFEDRPDTRNTTHMAVLELTYPFSIFSALKLSTTLRQDRTIFLPERPIDLDRDDILQQRIGLKLEYVFDNTFETMPNIRHGFRGKVFVEGMNRFRLQFDPGVFELNEALLGVVGVDARRYLRMDRHSILALRGAGAVSFGSEKILYYMGGTRNWLSTDFNSSTPVPNDAYAFQASAADLRGFRQNIRNGTSYVLTNTELRVPLFHYFSKGRIRSNFFRSFQLVGFFDSGTAWHGNSPFADDNPLNTETVTNPISSVTVRYFRDPFVVGYGGGVRLRVLGYFVRMDYAWGYETRRTGDPIFYFSLGQDF